MCNRNCETWQVDIEYVPFDPFRPAALCIHSAFPDVRAHEVHNQNENSGLLIGHQVVVNCILTLQICSAFSLPDTLSASDSLNVVVLRSVGSTVLHDALVVSAQGVQTGLGRLGRRERQTWLQCIVRAMQ